MEATLPAEAAAISPMEHIRQTLLANLSKVSDVFRRWDADGSGMVSRREFRRVLPVFGLSVAHADADALFAELDTDQSGSIDYGELYSALRAGSHIELDASLHVGAAGEITLAAEQRHALRHGELRGGVSGVLGGSTLSGSGGGEAETGEPLGGASLVSRLREALGRSLARVIDLFREWDEDGNGTVSKKEFRQAMQMLGVQCKPSHADALFAELDVDGSGKLEYGEMHKQLRKRFKEGGEVTSDADGSSIPDVATVGTAAASTACFTTTELIGSEPQEQRPKRQRARLAAAELSDPAARRLRKLEVQATRKLEALVRRRRNRQQQQQQQQRQRGRPESSKAGRDATAGSASASSSAKSLGPLASVLPTSAISLAKSEVVLLSLISPSAPFRDHASSASGRARVVARAASATSVHLAHRRLSALEALETQEKESMLQRMNPRLDDGITPAGGSGGSGLAVAPIGSPTRRGQRQLPFPPLGWSIALDGTTAQGRVQGQPARHYLRRPKSSPALGGVGGGGGGGSGGGHLYARQRAATSGPAERRVNAIMRVRRGQSANGRQGELDALPVVRTRGAAEGEEGAAEGEEGAAEGEEGAVSSSAIAAAPPSLNPQNTTSPSSPPLPPPPPPQSKLSTGEPSSDVRTASPRRAISLDEWSRLDESCVPRRNPFPLEAPSSPSSELSGGKKKAPAELHPSPLPSTYPAAAAAAASSASGKPVSPPPFAGMLAAANTAAQPTLGKKLWDTASRKTASVVQLMHAVDNLDPRMRALLLKEDAMKELSSLPSRWTEAIRHAIRSHPMHVEPPKKGSSSSSSSSGGLPPSSSSSMGSASAAPLGALTVDLPPGSPSSKAGAAPRRWSALNAALSYASGNPTREERMPPPAKTPAREHQKPSVLGEFKSKCPVCKGAGLDFRHCRLDQQHTAPDWDLVSSSRPQSATTYTLVRLSEAAVPSEEGWR
jgi:Ca2+-binding EF-hand superfamily protein